MNDIVAAFVQQDYRLEDKPVAGVAPISLETATHIRQYIDSYGCKLVELTQETWDTSVCIWTGNHWDAMVDLRTEEEGSSDLVLQARVSEAGTGYIVDVHMVYVP